jgi:predicted transcriptional regulator
MANRMTRPGPDPEVDDDEIIEIIVSARPPVLGTSGIADELPISHQAVARHLSRMEDDGLLHTEKMSNVRIWWPTPEGRALLRDEGQSSQ